MSKIVIAMALFSMVGAGGCLQVQPQPPLPPTTMSSWGPMGGFTMSSGSVCAGHATLEPDGATSIANPCFTGSDNIVMCTDTTAANAVMCAPSTGGLSISGTPGDTIAYARVR